jgi:hypothetical protein
MKKKTMKITGYVADFTADDQAFFIVSTQSDPPLWVYANNRVFRNLIYILTAADSNGVKETELTGTFYIQGRVLKKFEWAPASAIRVASLCIEPDEDVRVYEERRGIPDESERKRFSEMLRLNKKFEPHVEGE